MFKGGKKNFQNILRKKKLERMNHQKIRFRSFVKGQIIGETGSINRNHLSGECSTGKQMNMTSGWFLFLGFTFHPKLAVVSHMRWWPMVGL